MIQRIQTVYLLIVTGLLITAMCLPMGYFTDTMGEHPFKALGMDVNGAFQSTWGLFGILMLSTIVAFATIFLYKNRMLQIRMSIFNSLLLVGYYIAFFAFSQGAVIWMILSEMYPTVIRARGTAAGSFSHWIFNFAIALLFPVVSAKTGVGFVFVFFTVSTLLSIVFYRFALVETNGKSLEEIEKMILK